MASTVRSRSRRRSSPSDGPLSSSAIFTWAATTSANWWRELRGIPRSVLSKRLRMLEREGVIRATRRGRLTSYDLTDMGHELAEVCLLLGAWGARWREAKPENQDPYLALWTIAHLIDPASLPRRRVVVRFDVTDAHRYDRFWMVADHASAEVCTDPPGYTEDGIVTTKTGPLIRWYAGKLGISAAHETGEMVVVAPPWLEKELGCSGRLNPYAGIPHARFDPVDLPPGSGLALAAAVPAKRAAAVRRRAPSALADST